MTFLPHLLAVGFLIAATVNLSKLAGAAGVAPPLFAFAMALGSGIVLLAIALLMKERMPRDRQGLIYVAIAGFLGVAAPNYLAFEVARHVGAAYASVPYALSPLMTYAMSVMVGIDEITPRRMLGLALGFFGTMIIVAGRIFSADSAPIVWLLGALMMPVLVASGNVYRTLRWPKNLGPMPLAAGMMLASALWLVPVVALAMPAFAPLAQWPGGAVVAAQVAASVLMYWLFFILQRGAGPVYLSQIGYVSAGFGVLIAAILFGEQVTASMLAGLGFVACGVVFVLPRRT